MHDADSITKRMKNDLKLPQSKIELSFASDNIQAVAQEVESMYGYMDYVSDMHFIDTAKGEALERNAAAYGLKRKRSAPSVGVVSFYGAKGTPIPQGCIVETHDGLQFETIESGIITDLKKISLKVRCTVNGDVGNVPAYAVTKINTFLQGISRVENEFPILSGTNTETDEELRERLYLKIRTPATSGNKYHYLNWALSVDGVGRAKVFPLWKGPGTVKVSIIDANRKPAAGELMTKVRDFIDPLPGMGEGRAPIGATLTVSTAAIKELTVSCQITLDDGANLEGTKVKIKEAFDDYFEAIAYTDATTLSYAMATNMIFDAQGVKDVKSLQLNGDVKSISLNAEEIFMLKELEVSL